MTTTCEIPEKCGDSQQKNPGPEVAMGIVRRLQGLLTDSPALPVHSVREWCVQCFEPKHFDAVVIERALEGRCGLPSCSKAPLSCVEGRIKRRLHIWRVPSEAKKGELSTVEVDAEEVERFCSRGCYEASLWLRKKIPRDSVALRKLETAPFEGLGARLDFRDPTVDELLRKAFVLLTESAPENALRIRREEQATKKNKEDLKGGFLSCKKGESEGSVAHDEKPTPSGASSKPARGLEKFKRVRFGKFDHQVYNKFDATDTVVLHSKLEGQGVQEKIKSGERRTSIAPSRFSGAAAGGDIEEEARHTADDDTGERREFTPAPFSALTPVFEAGVDSEVIQESSAVAQAEVGGEPREEGNDSVLAREEKVMVDTASLSSKVIERTITPVVDNCPANAPPSEETKSSAPRPEEVFAVECASDDSFTPQMPGKSVEDSRFPANDAHSRLLRVVDAFLSVKTPELTQVLAHGSPSGNAVDMGDFDGVLEMKDEPAGAVSEESREDTSWEQSTPRVVSLTKRARMNSTIKMVTHAWRSQRRSLFQRTAAEVLRRKKLELKEQGKTQVQTKAIAPCVKSACGAISFALETRVLVALEHGSFDVPLPPLTRRDWILVSCALMVRALKNMIQYHDFVGLEERHPKVQALEIYESMIWSIDAMVLTDDLAPVNSEGSTTRSQENSQPALSGTGVFRSKLGSLVALLQEEE